MQYQLQSRIAGILTLTMLAGCAGDAAISRGGPSTVNGEKAIFDTRLVAGDCLFGHPDGGPEAFGALAATILPSLIDKGVTSLANLLKEAGKARQYEVALERPLQFSKGSGGVPKCFQIARGHFLTSPTATAPEGAWKPDRVDWSTLLTNGLTLAAEPDFFAELPFYLSNDGSAAAAAVRYVTYNKPMGSSVLRKTDMKRGLAINIAFLTDQQQDVASVPVISLDLGAQDAGYEIEYKTPQELDQAANQPALGSTTNADDSGSATDGSAQPLGDATGPGSSGGSTSRSTPQGNVAGATPLVGMGASSLPVTDTQRLLPITSRWIPITLTEDAKPVTVWAQLVEKQDSNKVLKFLGKTLEDSDIAEELKEAIVPGAKEKAEAEEAIEQASAVSAFYEAWAAADEAVAAFKAAMTRSNAIKARGAQENANVKALQAERTRPYPTLINPAEY